MSSTPKESTSRISSLDSLRGLAALIVLLNHLTLSFAPEFNGQLHHSGGFCLFGTPLFAIVNGGAAVILFFVLSGFVLTFRFLDSGCISPLPDVMIKRWPRLAGPVVVVSLASGLLMGAGLYRNVIVSASNGSFWLSLLFTWHPKGWTDVLAALWQGGFGTFLNGESNYNTNFWTMHFELLGSIAAYLLSIATIIAIKRIDWRIILAAMCLLWIREIYRFPYLSCFILGTIVALIHSKCRGFLWKGRISLLVAAAFCLFLGGYAVSDHDVPGGIYSLLKADTPAGELSLRVTLHSLMSLILLSAALWTPFVRDFLVRPMLTKIGHLSFPIYLLHLPVLCSLSCWAYLILRPLGGSILASLVAMAVAAVATLLLAFPLAALDDWWLLVLRRSRPFQGLLERIRSARVTSR